MIARLEQAFTEAFKTPTKRTGCAGRLVAGLNLNPKDSGTNDFQTLKTYYPSWLLEHLPNIAGVKLKN